MTGYNDFCLVTDPVANLITDFEKAFRVVSEQKVPLIAFRELMRPHDNRLTYHSVSSRTGPKRPPEAASLT